MRQEEDPEGEGRARAEGELPAALAAQDGVEAERSRAEEAEAGGGEPAVEGDRVDVGEADRALNERREAGRQQVDQGGQGHQRQGEPPSPRREERSRQAEEEQDAEVARAEDGPGDGRARRLVERPAEDLRVERSEEELPLTAREPAAGVRRIRSRPGLGLCGAVGRPRGAQRMGHLVRLRHEDGRGEGRAEEPEGGDRRRPRQPLPPGGPAPEGQRGGRQADEPGCDRRLRVPGEGCRGGEQGGGEEGAPGVASASRHGDPRQGEPGHPGDHGAEREERPGDDPAAEPEAQRRGPGGHAAEAEAAAEEEGAEDRGQHLEREAQQEELVERAETGEERGGREHRRLRVRPRRAAAVEEVRPERQAPRAQRRAHLGLPRVELEHDVVVGPVHVVHRRQHGAGHVAGDRLVERQEEVAVHDPRRAEEEHGGAGGEALRPGQPRAEPPGERLQRELPDEEERPEEDQGHHEGRSLASALR